MVILDGDEDAILIEDGDREIYIEIAQLKSC